MLLVWSFTVWGSPLAYSVIIPFVIFIGFSKFAKSLHRAAIRVRVFGIEAHFEDAAARKTINHLLGALGLLDLGLSSVLGSGLWRLGASGLVLVAFRSSSGKRGDTFPACLVILRVVLHWCRDHCTPSLQQDAASRKTAAAFPAALKAQCASAARPPAEVKR